MKKPRDLNAYAKSTTIQLIIGALVIILLLGTILIYKFYGANAAVLGLFCLFAGLLPVVLIIGIMVGINRFLEKEHKKQQ